MPAPEIDRYAQEHSTAASAQMQTLAEEARGTLPRPGMLSGLTVGRLLETLVFALRARLVLEIGTYAGYSALSMAAGLAPGGRLLTCEISPEIAGFARRHIEASPYADRIEVCVGPALETISGLEGPFDLVFIDADKVGYPAYYEAVLPKLAPGGLIAVDNTLRDGRVLDDPGGWDEDTRAMARFNDDLIQDQRVVCVLLTVRDGVTLIRRR